MLRAPCNCPSFSPIGWAAPGAPSESRPPEIQAGLRRGARHQRPSPRRSHVPLQLGTHWRIAAHWLPTRDLDADEQAEGNVDTTITHATSAAAGARSVPVHQVLAEDVKALGIDTVFGLM